MATDKRNLSEWRNETTKVGLMLDNLIETAEDKPYAYILIAVEKESDGTAVGLQVNGMGGLLAQGLASFLTKDDYTSLIQVANHLAAQSSMDGDDELITCLRSIFGDK